MYGKAYYLEIFLFFFIGAGCGNNSSNDRGGNKDSASVFNRSDLLKDDEWNPPDTLLIPDNENGGLIHYGRKLIVNTGYYFGPSGTINHFANGMNCQNCHLNAGTILYANSFSAVFSIYPKFRPRSGSVEHLEKRINDCFERSLNGTKLDSLSKEMRAMVAYINWVGKDVKKGESPKGASVADLPYLDRAADPQMGEKGFQKYCITCHGSNGFGKYNEDLAD